MKCNAGQTFCLFRFPLSEIYSNFSGFENTACELKLGENMKYDLTEWINRMVQTATK